jgi:hypothetical protein
VAPQQGVGAHPSGVAFRPGAGRGDLAQARHSPAGPPL